MSEIVVWIFITIVLIILFIVMMLLAIVKKNKRLAVWSVIPVLCCMITGGIVALKLLKKGYDKVKDRQIENPLKKRSGSDIYNALFGKSLIACVSIINYKDQYIPGMDCCIWLQFSTCPEELERILQQEKYEWKEVDTTLLNISGENEKPSWWKPETLGNRVHFFIKDHEGHRLQQLLSSADSTSVFYCDILY